MGLMRGIQTLTPWGHIGSAERMRRLALAGELAEASRRKEEGGLWYVYERPEGAEDARLQRAGVWYEPYKWLRITKYGRGTKEAALNACIAQIGFFCYQQRQQIGDHEFIADGMRYRIDKEME